MRVILVGDMGQMIGILSGLPSACGPRIVQDYLELSGTKLNKFNRYARTNGEPNQLLDWIVAR